MIWRGLQILLVGLALGAASSHGQVRFPASVVIDGVTVANGYPDPNGLYVFNGFTGSSPNNVYVYQRFGTYVAGQQPYMLEVQYRAGANTVSHQVYRLGGFNASSVAGTIVASAYTGPAPAQYGPWLPGADLAKMSGGVAIWHTESNPYAYEEAFPDWQSAGTKIPLGFGMGMAFWALAASLVIPLKWARDLASAAT